jgi:hypothetical protein
MEDQLAATDMAMRAYTKLKELEPTHELVLLMESDDPNADFNFKEKFWDKEERWDNLPGSMVTAYVETKYFVAARKVLKEKYQVDI